VTGTNDLFNVVWVTTRSGIEPATFRLVRRRRQHSQLDRVHEFTERRVSVSYCASNSVSSTRPSSRDVVSSVHVTQVFGLSWWTGSSAGHATVYAQSTIDLLANVDLDDWSQQTIVDERRPRAPWSHWTRVVHGTYSARCHHDAIQQTHNKRNWVDNYSQYSGISDLPLQVYEKLAIANDALSNTWKIATHYLHPANMFTRCWI